MKIKLKHCDGECRQDKPIWKNEDGKRYCKSCWSKILSGEIIIPIIKKQKPIPKQSDRRKKLDLAYTILRKKHLETHKFCELLCSPECNGVGEDIHHLYWAGDREEFMNDFSEVKVGCRSCHKFVHEKMSSEEVIEKGFRKIKQ
jgi:hypothetical protein